MTRFHKLLIATALLAAVAIAFRNFAAVLLMVVLVVAVIGLGVTCPRLSLFGSYICRGQPSRRCVTLTFDDGPDAHSTPLLLDLLKAEQIKAAFFCVGRRVNALPALVRRIVDEGHLVENHSFEHSHFTNFFSVGRLTTELTNAQSAILSATGKSPRYFRPPMGLTNPRTFRAASAVGLKVIGWSIRGFDTMTHDPHKVVSRILRRVRSGDIILLHDGGIPGERLRLTMKLLLDGLRAREYEIVRLDQIVK